LEYFVPVSLRTRHWIALLAFAMPCALVAQQAPKPTPQQAEALLKGRPDLLAQLRQRIMTSGMTPDQVRARLRAEGYPENLLDAYLTGATTGGDATPSDDVFTALRALGISDSTDVDSLRAMVGPANEKAAQPVVPLNAANDLYTTNPYLTKAQRDREDSLSRLQAASGRTRMDMPIFGANLFRSTKTEFQPNLDGPVDATYRLGPGDRLVLILTGEVETAQTLDVTREGFVLIPQVGQIAVANLTVAQLEELLYARLGRVYSGVKKGSTATTHFQVSIAKLRSNQVFVVGDVVRPGSYRVSSAGTLMTALYAAGGPSDNGTFRTISLRRGGKEVGKLDVYDYLVRGDASRDLRLESGDVVFVGTHGPHVRIVGEITRSAIYELHAGETLADLVMTAGGLTASASKQRIQIERVVPSSTRGTAEQRTLIEVTNDAALGSKAPSLQLEAGDYVRIFSVAERVRNRLVVKGNVWRAGAQAFTPGLTLSEALRRAGGAKPDSYLGQVLVSRLQDDSTRTQLHAMLRDTSGAVLGADLPLADDDELTVFSLTDFRPKQYVAVSGAVRKPGQIPFRLGMTVRDAILLTGGPTEKAYLQEVEIARLPSTRAPGQKAVTTRVPLDSSTFSGSGLSAASADAKRGDGSDVLLTPYDNILVMQAPDWRLLETVWVTGEVRFPGKYTIRDKSERVRDLIVRAGGLLPTANLDAAYLGRHRAATSYQNAADKTANSLVRLGADIAAAFAQPASQDNLLVEAGDSLDIPVEQATVEVRGAVNSPTTTVVSRGASISYYLRAAGGVSVSGDVGRSYVIQPNGKIEARRSLFFLSIDPTPRPGATVVIPVRDTTNSSAAALLGTISTISSVVAGLLTAYALIKR